MSFQVGHNVLGQVLRDGACERFTTVKALLDEMSRSFEDSKARKEGQSAEPLVPVVFADFQQKSMSADFTAAMKEIRRTLAVKSSASSTVAACKKLSKRQCVDAVMLSVVNAAAHHIKAVEKPEDLDLLATLNMPYFPACHGGPLSFAESRGWESVGDDNDRLLRQTVYADAPEGQRPVSGQEMERRFSAAFAPTHRDGRVTQTLFPGRAGGIKPSNGLAGLLNGRRQLPVLAPFDTTHVLTVLMVCCIVCLIGLLISLVYIGDLSGRLW